MNRKHTAHRSGRLAAAVLFVLVVLYVLVQMFSIMNKEYRTEIATRYTVVDSIIMKAAAAFESQPVAGDGRLGYLVESGERVSTGQAVAQQYTSQEQAAANQQLRALQHRQDLLQQSSNIDGASLDVLAQQMQNSLYEILDALDAGQYAACGEEFDRYLVAASKVQLMTGQAEDFSGAAAQLQTESEQLEQVAGTPAVIQAPVSGYFVPASAQHTRSYTTEELAGMTASQLQQAIESPIPADDSGAGRIVTDYCWNLFGVLTQEQAARLSTGQKLNVRLPKRGVELPMTVELLEDAESGLVKVQLSCENLTPQIVDLNIEEAQLVLAEYEGIRVSKEAQHVATVTGEDGTQREAYGVYVKQGGLMYFREIASKLYENDEFILLPLKDESDTQPAEEEEKEENKNKPKNEVREYDEVIVEGKDLGDGRLL